jgi:hypothetical protein
VTNDLAERGWSEQATPLDDGLVRCENCTQTTPADEIAVDSVCRVEGASDPDDMAIVVALTCPHCDSRDSLVLKYGPEASIADADVLEALQLPPAEAQSRDSSSDR